MTNMIFYKTSGYKYICNINFMSKLTVFISDDLYYFFFHYYLDNE